MQTDTSGTLHYTILTGRTTPTEWGGDEANTRTNYRHFDDFLGGVAPVITTAGETHSWLTHADSTANAAVAVVDIEPEGAFRMTWDNVATDVDNEASISLANLSQAALVSSGLTVVEVRAHFSSVADGIWNIGFADRISVAEGALQGFDMTSANVLSESPDTTCVDCAFIMTDDALVSNNWVAGSLNGNTFENNAIGFEATTGATASTYQIFRIEIDATGDAYYFLDGALFFAQTTAVATTALIIPFISVYETVTGTDGFILVDYIDFWAARPAG